jgi:hypothetical protein
VNRNSAPFLERAARSGDTGRFIGRPCRLSRGFSSALSATKAALIGPETVKSQSDRQ